MAEQKTGAKKTEAPPPPLASMNGIEVLVAIVVFIALISAAGAYFSDEWRAAFIEIATGILNAAQLVATIIVMIALAIAVYAYIRIGEISGAETKDILESLSWEHERVEKNRRWERIEEGMRSLNPSDWKVAILEADGILDDIVTRMGYPGKNLGERMKMIESSDFPMLDLAWKAHKTRNEIAHQSDIERPLSRAEADQTINIYHRIFKELGYL